MPKAEPELLNVLVAYPYMKERALADITAAKDKIRLIVDSGAFTAWKAKKEIKLDDYCKFIEKLPVKPWRYFTLDVIGDPARTLSNYETMLKRGFRPIPIFTRGEDPGVMDDYYKTSDVVAIGGLVGTLGNKGFVNGIMEKVGKRRCHWLGFTSLEFVKHYRPYMCDSSSWETSMYGGVVLYDRAGKMLRLSKQVFATKPSAEAARIIRSYGVDPAVLAKDATGWSRQGSGNRVLNAMSAARMSMEVQRLLGTFLFIAAQGGNSDIRRLIHGHDFEMKRRART